MQVANIKTAELKNRNYSSNKGQGNDFKTDKYNQSFDRFLSKAISGEKISFGASIEYYAKKYLNTANFEATLRKEIRDDELGVGKKILNTLFGGYEGKITSKFNEVIDRISKLKEEIAENTRRVRKLERELENRQSREIRIKQEQAELEKKIKLEEINTRRKKIQLEKKKLEFDKEKINLEKDLLQEQKLSDYTNMLKNEFINLAQIENQERASGKIVSKLTFPNGIMLSGLDKSISNELVEWIVRKADCNLEKVNFADLTNNEVLMSLDKIAQNAEKSDKRTLIYIENFDKFTTPKEENDVIIPKLKAFLTSCAEKYKCTVITNVQDQSRLAPEIKAPQRFKVVVNADD